MRRWSAFKSKLPKTYLCFPVVGRVPQRGETLPKEARRQSNNRGVALIIAIMAVAMIMIFSSNMIVTSTVNMELAMANRDNIKAEYMAKSGQNLAVYLLSVDWALDLFTFQMTKKPPSDGTSDIWSFVNGMPIGGDTIEMISKTQEQFDLKAVNDEKTLSTLKQFDGQFVIEIEDELSKINLAKCNLAACRDVVTMLEALMSCPAEKAFLEKKNLVPRQMAYRIKDWIDSNTTPDESGFSTEDDPYEKKNPPYTSKNAPMESVNELMLIEGWDEEMHAVFSPFITIYPYIRQEADAKLLNVNTANKALLGCLFPSAKSECTEKFYGRLLKNDDPDTKADFASDRASLQKFLSEDLCYNKDESDDRTQWFTYRSSVFRIKVTGEVGNQQKKIEMVIERTIPDKVKKLEYSYNILYWKLI